MQIQVNTGSGIDNSDALQHWASEHLNAFAVVQDGAVVAELPTYRGEGKAFL